RRTSSAIGCLTSETRLTEQQKLLVLDVVAEQKPLIADVQAAVRDNRMRPRWKVTAVGLLQAAAFDELLAAGLDQDKRPLFASQVQATVCHGQRALGGLTTAPEDFAGLIVQTGQESAFVAAVRAIESAVPHDHAAVVVLHGDREILLLGLPRA